MSFDEFLSFYKLMALANNMTAAGQEEPMDVDSMADIGRENWMEMVPADSGRDYVELAEFFNMFCQAHEAARLDEMQAYLQRQWGVLLLNNGRRYDGLVLGNQPHEVGSVFEFSTGSSIFDFFLLFFCFFHLFSVLLLAHLDIFMHDSRCIEHHRNVLCWLDQHLWIRARSRCRVRPNLILQ